VSLRVGDTRTTRLAALPDLSLDDPHGLRMGLVGTSDIGVGLFDRTSVATVTTVGRVVCGRHDREERQDGS
jgi:hypothetical protein